MAVGLLFLLSGGLLRAQAAGTIEYPENGTGPVATYTAVDPEGTAITSWTLAGTDAGALTIEGGVLRFAKTPNYETPADVVGTDGSTAVADDNMYEITVQAMDSTGKTAEEAVMVEVTNVDEDGTVTLSARRPLAGVAFTAGLTDPDGAATNPKWQWAKSRTKNGSYTDIDGAEAATYTPTDASDKSDTGYHLRATVSYTDPEDSGKSAIKSAMMKSDYTVRATRRSNSAPEFAADQDPTMDNDQPNAAREVAENTEAGTDIGAPVVATDKDSDDVLTYTLTGAGADSFAIDWATGQLMTKAALDFETTPSYTVVVRATDPAGVPQMDAAVADNSGEVTVDITVTDVNEAPAVAGDAAVTFNEDTVDITASLGNDTYTATDPDVEAPTPTWSVAGPDGGKFTAVDGELKFKAKPDYENATDANGDNVYEVTVQASDGKLTGMRKVKVTVENADEAGVVTLSKTQPRVGIAVTASLTDPDGSISGLTWQWSRSNTAIENANSDTYKPVTEDVTNTLKATASYTDGHGSGKTAEADSAHEVAVDTRNKAPAFVDQDTDTDGVQNDMATRKVDENTEADAADDAAENDETADNVGAVVMATDPDPNAETPTYTLGGADAAKFRVRANGQIEVGSGTKLDYETRTTYMVTLTAKDSFASSSSIMVTIEVNPIDEVPDVSGEETPEYLENGTGSVATYTAMDPEGTAIASWSLDGTDADAFTIEGGVLRFAKTPDYETPADVVGTSPPTATVDNMYEIMVRAMDSTGKTAEKAVMVEVTNVDEDGTVTLSARRPLINVAFTAELTDLDGDATNLKWQWAKSRTKNGSYTDIDGAEALAYTPIDDEGKNDAGYYLRVTVSYTDPEDSGKSAMMKSDYTVRAHRVSNSAPEFAADQDPTMDNDQPNAAREVAENTEAGTDIGAPVVATDKDSDDVLTYTLTGAGADSFAIDWATGQLMTKAALDFETTPSYTVVVRATDPAGVPQVDAAVADNSGEVTVDITVTDVNEAPAVAGDAAVTFNEDTVDITASLGNDTYTATDPDVEAPTPTWSVAGPDGGKFTAVDGELKFKAKPDYENATDANGDNVYEVTVQASDGKLTGMRKVKVTVENADEAGVVALSKTQPRVGIAVTASLTDPDGSISGLTWQWSRSNTAIENANSDTYKPVTEDVTNTLKATASYTDGHGSGKTAEADSAHEVAVDTRNKAPAFVDQDTDTDGVQNDMATRKVDENTEADAADDAAENDETADNVGAVVMATDPDPNAETPTYTLGGTDAAKFRVRANGQIEVGSGTKLDYETRTTYMVTLTAEDSFGSSSSIAVTIMVNPIDEAPEIMRAPDANVAPEFASATATRMVTENTAAGGDIGNPVAANDANGDALTYALGGTDAASFDIDTGSGQLMTLAALDYETKASYEVTVTASDSGSAIDMITVTITVTNEEEMGEVTLWAGADALTMAPQVGDTITGAVMDPDGGVTGETWQWSKTMDMSDMGSWMDIQGATNAAYMVMEGDTGYYLRVMATYTDAAGTAMVYSMPTMMVTTMMTVPTFESEIATRVVAENTAADTGIGDPVMVTDADGDTLTYTLGGTDAASFNIGSTTGQLMTLAALDYETKASYSVTVTASDSGSAIDMITVTITVTNEEEMGEVTLWAGADALTMAPQVGDTITGAVMDPDGGVTGETWQWSKTMDMSDMGSWMDIQGATNAAYMVMEGDTGYYLRVMATYTDAAGTAMVYSMPTMMVTTMMTVPTFESEIATRVVAENTAADTGIGDPVMVTDADGDTLTYTLGGTDAASFNIGSTTGQLMTLAALDYETKASYSVTVTASDSGSAIDMITVTITVTNEEEMGEVTLWAGADALTMAPQVGDTITGAVMDPDGGVTGETWQWSKTMDMSDMGSWMDIQGATNAAYMVMEGDTGYYLRVMAMYTDGHGESKSAAMESANAVTAADETQPVDFDPLAKYDADNSGAIDHDEVIQAINDYLFGEGADAISKEEVMQTINLYLFPSSANSETP